MRIVLLTLLAFVAVQAVAAEPVKLDSLFDLKEVAFVKQPGTATVAGKTYGNTNQGQILLVQNPPKFTPDVPEYLEMLLKGACDERGEFTFAQVPAAAQELT